MTKSTRFDPASPEAPRRHNITILISDLTDSTGIVKRLDHPEVSKEMFTRLQAIFEEVIDKHEGKVAQIAGEGVTAFFGYPEPREDDVLRAVEAALELREASRALGDEGRWRGSALKLKTGIHSGEVLVTEGDAVRGRFELHGQATHDTKHLCDEARPDKILVSDSALGPHRNLFYTGCLSSKQLRGNPDAVPAVLILGRAPINSRYAGSKRAGLLPFLGRQAELLHLSRSLDRVVGDAGLFLKIRGAAGEGKTRLAEEFLYHASERGCIVYRGECDATAEPLQPFLQIARSIFGIAAKTAADEATIRVERRLAQLDKALLDRRRALFQLLSLGDADAEPDEVLDALRATIARLATHRPVVLFIDDWHTADDASRAMRAMLRDIGSLLTLVTARSGESPSAEIDDAEILDLPPLGPAETDQAATFLLRSCAPFTLEAIREATGGTPLFIEEMCHSIEAGQTEAKASDRMAWLRTLIRSRFSRLPEDQADLVRTAAIIGNSIPAWLLAQMCWHDAGDPILNQLAREDFIFPAEREGTLRFKHGLTRQVIYESISPDQRTTVHLRVAKELQGRTPLPGEEDPVEALAYHFGEAGDYPAAAQYAERAATKAMAAHALDRAQAQYRAALAALEQQPQDADTAAKWDWIAGEYFRAGVFDPSPDQLPTFESAIERARLRRDTKALARSQYWLGYINYGLGEPLAAIHHCERALAGALALDDDRLVVQIRATLGQARAAASDYDGALALLDEAIAIKRRHMSGRGPPIGLAYSLSCKAFALGDMGRFDTAYACFREALAAIGGSKHEVEVSVLNQYAVVCLWQGWNDEACRLAEAGMAVAEHVRSHYSHAMSRSIRAFACWSVAPDPGAVQTIVEATAWLETKGRGQFTSLNHGWLAEMMVAEGRFAESLRFAKRAMRRARKRDRLGEAMALRALARRAATLGGARPAGFFLDCATRSAQARQSPHELAATDLCRAEL